MSTKQDASQAPEEPRSKSWRKTAITSRREVAIFTRQLAIMQSAGVDLMLALDILIASPDDANFCVITADVAASLENGETLSDSLRAFPRVFSIFYCSMIKIGESTGQLVAILERLSDWIDQDMSTTAKVKAAFAYPTLVLVTSFVLAMFMFTQILPQFFETLISMGGELPLVTRVLIRTTDLICNPGAWAMIVTLLLCTLTLLKNVLADPKTAAGMFKVVMCVPGFGTLLRVSSAHRFAASIAVCLETGVDVLTSLKLASACSGSPAIVEDAPRFVESVQQGNTLSSHIGENPHLYSSTMYHLVGAGEESAKTAKAFEHVAKIHAEELDSMTQGLTALLEPIMLAVAAVCVTTVLLAIFVPLYSSLENF